MVHPEQNEEALGHLKLRAAFQTYLFTARRKAGNSSRHSEQGEPCGFVSETAPLRNTEQGLAEVFLVFIEGKIMYLP